MNNNVTPFPIDPKLRMTFQIGGRKHVLIIPAISLARRPNRAEVIPISTARDRPGVQPAGAQILACIHCPAE
jgi:hypothetical protein